MALRVCDAPGCETFTLGTLCALHEPLEPGPFPRGRPFRDHEALQPAGVSAGAGSGPSRPQTALPEPVSHRRGP